MDRHLLTVLTNEGFILSGSEHSGRLRHIPVAGGEQHTNNIHPPSSSPRTFNLLTLGLADHERGRDSEDAAETLSPGHTDLGSGSQAQCKYNNKEQTNISLKFV